MECNELREKSPAAQEIITIMESMRDDAQSRHLARFSKTGEGEYGFGDRFLGIRVPQTRRIVKEIGCGIDFTEIEKLLYCGWHEVRLAGFLLLVAKMKYTFSKKRKETDEELAAERKEIVNFYLEHSAQANNWDLVDLSAPYIVGEFLKDINADRGVLYQLSKDSNLWRQRISIVSTLALIRSRDFDDAIRISEILLPHQHDLIRKATGWMLREIGKRDKNTLVGFLNRNHSAMSRTSLRYAIEKFPETERQYWLKK